MTRFAAVGDLLSRAVADGVMPAAVIEVGRENEALWRAAVGRLTYDPDAPEVTSETIFDLASLTKVISTTSLTMRAVDAREIGLEDRLRRYISAWRGRDREDVTVRDLLAHCSGLTAYLPFFRDYQGRIEFERAICDLPLEYPPRTRALYSDLGFMLLGFILQDVLGASLDKLFDHLRESFTEAPLRFHPPTEWRAHTAPTEVDPWRGRLLVGEVHDENAYALGSPAGHTGLFGTAGAVGDFARAVLANLDHDSRLGRRDTMRLFTTRTTDIPGSSRALGWDTMLPTSSCGTKLSPRAIGHTGFTGTSLWIDPGQDLYIVLLTNRVHPTRENDRLPQMRGTIHDAVVDAVHA